MAMTTTAMIALAAMSAASSVAGGIAAKNEANAQAALFGQQVQVLESQKKQVEEQRSLEKYRFERQKRKAMSTAIARTASAGLNFSGSPVTSAIDTLTQIGLDEAVGQFNLDIQAYNIEAKQSQARMQQSIFRQSGKNAMMTGVLNAGIAIAQTGIAMGKPTSPTVKPPSSSYRPIRTT